MPDNTLDKDELMEVLFTVFGLDGSDKGLADVLWDIFSGPDNWERRTATAAMQALLVHHGSAMHPDMAADKAMEYCAALEGRLEKSSQKRLDEWNALRHEEALKRQQAYKKALEEQEAKELFGI
jgi:hypothetical protein